MAPETYSITDLARLTGVNVRTIRYYLAQGLLPASGESGPGAHYGEGHLDRLRLTKRLQQQHLPLSEIRRQLSELTDAQVSSLLATTPVHEQTPSTSALDYVRSILGTPLQAPPEAHPAPPAPALAAAPPAPAAGALGTPLASKGAVPLFRRQVAEAPAPAYAEPDDAEPSDGASISLAKAVAPAIGPDKPGDPKTEPPSPERSQWERLVLGPNIELHVRRPLSRLEQRRVERLIAIARQVLNEDQS